MGIANYVFPGRSKYQAQEQGRSHTDALELRGCHPSPLMWLETLKQVLHNLRTTNAGNKIKQHRRNTRQASSWFEVTNIRYKNANKISLNKHKIKDRKIAIGFFFLFLH